MMEKLPILWIVVPCYNEEKVLPITSSVFMDELELLIKQEKINARSRILYVNDCSEDNTWNIIKNLNDNNEKFIGISQNKNRGHQSSILAGMFEAFENNADLVVTIDCDGQDDIHAIREMLEENKKGAEIIYGVRKDRSKDTFLKKFTAETFYKVMKFLGAEVIFNHADYRMMSKKAINELTKFKEVNLFLRGIIPLLGFKTSKVYYNREERVAGKSHYPFVSMLALAFNGITSFSIKPIRFITAFGFGTSVLSFLGILWIFISYILGGKTVSGWASLISVVGFMGGVQMISLGVLGEYIGKIYLETKERPRYIIDERIG